MVIGPPYRRTPHDFEDSRDGHDLIVVARRGGRLEELKQRLESAHAVSVQTLVADLSTEPGLGAYR